MRRSIGDALDDLFEGWAMEDDGYSAAVPVETLFLWISQQGGLDPAWLQDADGEYIDDTGRRVDKTVPRSVSGAETLAAYGLWLLEVDMLSIGNPEDEDWDEYDTNPNGFSQVDAIDHRAGCLLLAYQALLYAERLARGAELSPAEAAQAKLAVDFAEKGRLGAERRHAGMRALKAYAVALFQERDWRSHRSAARALKAQIIEHGRSIGAVLVDDNAERTIYNWFRKQG
jgi:hypothetical protein